MADTSCICPPERVNKTVHNFTCPQDRALGVMCRAHFDQRNAKNYETAECVACQQARRDEATKLQQQHTIDPEQPYGAHIALQCRNHPLLRWHTKNIDYIGARSIFYSEALAGPECKCPASDLEVASA
jgi:hypothetical protein